MKKKILESESDWSMSQFWDTVEKVKFRTFLYLALSTAKFHVVMAQ